VLICDTFKQKHKEKKMSYWLAKITLLTCKSLVLCSFLQSSTVRANETVLLGPVPSSRVKLTRRLTFDLTLSKNAFQEHLTAGQMRVNLTELDRPVKSPVSG